MPRGDNRRGARRSPGRSLAQERVPELAPVQVAGGVLRERAEQFAVAFRLLEQISGCKTVVLRPCIAAE